MDAGTNNVRASHLTVAMTLTFNSILASWDMEEYGLVGSTEWGEENAEWLSKTCVACRF
jgi:hypothetical protein